MVKKLFKHEFIALFRALAPIEAVVLGVGILSRLVLFFEQDTTAFDIVYGMTVFALAVALVGGPVAALILSVIRFYKNLFSGEGYLSFTLPVTPTQHIFVKLVTAVAVQLLAVLVSGITFCIAFSNEMLVQIWQTAVRLFRAAYGNLDGLHLSLYIAEIALLLLVEMFYLLLVYYTCICLGQTAKKNRVLCAVGCYFAYYMINQVVSTVLMVVFSVLSLSDFFIGIGRFITLHPYATVHIALWSAVVWLGLLSVVFFFISRFVMGKKLNLES